MQDSDGTSQKSVLLVEDDALIAADIAMQIEELGFRTLGPCHSLDEAMTLLQDARPDIALLDFNLRKGESSAPVAKRLSDIGVPFSFLSGYSRTSIIKDAGFPDALCLSKPVMVGDLSKVLQDLSQNAAAQNITDS